MAFNIKIPFVMASHGLKRAGTAPVSKAKASPFGFNTSNSNKFWWKEGSTLRYGVSEDATQTLTGKTLTSPTITGAIVSGASVPVTASGGATRQLTAAGSGSVNLFDAATGITYTLPANPTVGLYYDFYVNVLQTAGSNIIIANAAPASTFLIGSVTSFSGEQVTPSSTLGPYIHNAPLASSFVQIKTNGTTTGGGAGSWFRFVCLSTTTWFVTGVNHSPSGNLATPFSV